MTQKYLFDIVKNKNLINLQKKIMIKDFIFSCDDLTEKQLNKYKNS